MITISMLSFSLTNFNSKIYGYGIRMLRDGNGVTGLETCREGMMTASDVCLYAEMVVSGPCPQIYERGDYMYSVVFLAILLVVMCWLFFHEPGVESAGDGGLDLVLAMEASGTVVLERIEIVKKRNPFLTFAFGFCLVCTLMLFMMSIITCAEMFCKAYAGIFDEWKDTGFPVSSDAETAEGWGIYDYEICTDAVSFIGWEDIFHFMGEDKRPWRDRTDYTKIENTGCVMVSSGDFSVMEICGYNYIMIPGMAFRMSDALDVAGGDYLILYSVEAHEEINGLDCYRYVTVVDAESGGIVYSMFPLGYARMRGSIWD